MNPFTDLSRRIFLTRTGQGLAGLAVAALPGRALALGTTSLGGKELMILSDGHLALPIDFAFPDVPADELKALLAASGQGPDMLLPDCNVTLLRDGDRLVIFDVGAGPNFMPTAGTLADSLAEAGIDPAEVTDVVFTHAHPDHIWGLVDDFDELVFPEAAYHMNLVEWDYWRADDTLEKTPEARKSFVVGAQSRFEYLADQINLFGYGDEILPGIEAVDTAGHTPGHTSFAIHEGSDSIMIVGDAVSNVAVSFLKPDWPSGSDQDTQKGAEARMRLLDRLVADKAAMVGFHMPHPGIGRVEREGSAYRFAV